MNKEAAAYGSTFLPVHRAVTFMVTAVRPQISLVEYFTFEKKTKFFFPVAGTGTPVVFLSLLRKL